MREFFPRLELDRARPKISPYAKNQPWGYIPTYQTWGQALSKGLKSKPKALSEGLKPKPFF